MGSFGKNAYTTTRLSAHKLVLYQFEVEVACSACPDAAAQRPYP
jgi:hypothetical protein